MNLKVCLTTTAFLAALSFVQLEAAEVYQVGSRIAEFTAKDQHGESFVFKPGVRVLIVAFDMSTGKDANEKLDKLGADFLKQHDAVYVSNIYGMPGIGRVFALPKMKKYKHRIILADEKGLVDPFPRKDHYVTVLTLDSEARITEVRYWNPEKEAIEPLFTSTKK